MPTYVPYSPDVETPDANEQETHAKIIDMMQHGMALTREKYGTSVRISHAKAHGLLKGTLTVAEGLPEYLAQGLFAKPGTYDVIVRLATAPGEYTDDSKLSTDRGMSIKVFGVEGPHLAPFGNITTQDFVLDTGKQFLASNAATFLQAFKPNADIAPKLSDDVKGAVSAVARGTNAVLHAVGMNSEKLGFYGHEKKHPLSEEYYSQAPHRYGRYIAKFGVIPSGAGVVALQDQPFDPETPDALREATVAYFKQNPAEFQFKVQLNTDLDSMKIEDAKSAWSEDESPYQTVATLTLPVQDAYDPTSEGIVEPLSFSPAHTLEAFRPLGSLQRARLAAYTALAETRRSQNGMSTAEPATDPLR